jgi:hypothetical protein
MGPTEGCSVFISVNCVSIALGLTQPLPDMSTRNIFWGVKVPGAKGWQLCNLHMLIVLKSGSLNLLEPLEPLKAFTGIDIPLLIWNVWVLRFLRQCCWMFSPLRCYAVTFQSYLRCPRFQGLLDFVCVCVCARARVHSCSCGYACIMKLQ